MKIRKNNRLYEDFNRTTYKGYIIDKDNLGRVYVYNPKSPYSEDSDHILIHNGSTLKAAKETIDDFIWKKSHSEINLNEDSDDDITELE